MCDAFWDEILGDLRSQKGFLRAWKDRRVQMSFGLYEGGKLLLRGLELDSRGKRSFGRNQRKINLVNKEGLTWALPLSLSLSLFRLKMIK